MDSMTSYLWMYEGTVDESDKIPTLETEGPRQETPGQMAKYEEVIEIKDKDHKIFRSFREKAGEWTKGAEVHYRRKALGPAAPLTRARLNGIVGGTLCGCPILEPSCTEEP